MFLKLLVVLLVFGPHMAKEAASLGVRPLAQGAVVPDPQILRWLSRLAPPPGEKKHHDTKESCSCHTNEEFLKHRDES